MFKLKKYFLLTGGVAFSVFLVVSMYTTYLRDISDLRTIGERENLLLAGFLSQLLEQQITQYLALPSPSKETLKKRDEVRQIKQLVKDYSNTKEILKIKIFNPDGLTLFSSNQEEIGFLKQNSQPIHDAFHNHKSTSKMVFKDTFETLSGISYDRDIVETYIPIVNSKKQTIAIFELYADVTELVHEAEQKLWKHFFYRIAAYLSLFILLYLLVLRADNLIKQQYIKLQHANTELANAKNNLDLQVEEKTRELSDTISVLQLETHERMEAEQELKKLSVAVEQSPSAIIITDTQSRIQYINPMFTDMTGWVLEEVEGKTTGFLGSGQTPPSQYKKLWKTISSGNVWKGEIHNKKKNGDTYLQSVTISPILDAQGNIINYLSIGDDITLQKKHEEKIHHLAHHDSLTGLYNRFSLEHRLEQAISYAIRNDELLAVLFLDLDRFKTINDTLGHKAGDELLIQVADRLKATCRRDSDIVARIGGDEFVVVLSEIKDLAFIGLTAQALVEVLSLPYNFEQEEMLTSPSIGIVVYPGDGDDAEALLKNADVAMYHAKDSGRSNYQFFTEELNKSIEEKIQLEKELRKAIDNHDFELAYQPKICTNPLSVCGMEALIRWNHPQQGFISPEKFIPIAEDIGLINELGIWVMKTALTQLKTWKQAGLNNIQMSVNVSARQLESEELFEVIKQQLSSLGLKPSDLELEITESAAMQDPEKAILRLQKIHDIGIDMAIDDFGTGHSSLAYLKMLPINTLKLDKSFVMNLEHDENNASICKAAISLGHELGLKIVAEGVETQAQKEFLEKRGCDILQGYYFSRPVNAVECEKYIETF